MRTLTYYIYRLYVHNTYSSLFIFSERANRFNFGFIFVVTFKRFFRVGLIPFNHEKVKFSHCVYACTVCPVVVITAERLHSIKPRKTQVPRSLLEICDGENPDNGTS